MKTAIDVINTWSVKYFIFIPIEVVFHYRGETYLYACVHNVNLKV